MKRQSIKSITNTSEFIVPDNKSYIIAKLDQYNKIKSIPINILSKKNKFEGIKQYLKKKFIIQKYEIYED